jgi:hypothetical protein
MSMQVSAQTTRDKQTVSGQHNGTPMSHVRNSFELTVHAPYKVAAPLFGPEGERSWAGADWDPQFIYPHPPKDSEGAVFTVKHGSHQSTWVNTGFDSDRRHFQYVYFVDNVMVTVINLFEARSEVCSRPKRNKWRGPVAERGGGGRLCRIRA